jgi:hypothetical protein
MSLSNLSMVFEAQSWIGLLHGSTNGAVCFEFQPGPDDSMENCLGL